MIIISFTLDQPVRADLSRSFFFLDLFFCRFTKTPFYTARLIYTTDLKYTCIFRVRVYIHT